MPVTRLEILEKSPFASGTSFGDAGAYERIDAIAHYEVDPGNAANDGVCDANRLQR